MGNVKEASPTYATPNLSVGSAGSIVLYGALCRVRPNDAELRVGLHEAWATTQHLLESQDVDAGLFSGLAGVAWAIETYGDLVETNPGTDAFLDLIDQILEKDISKQESMDVVTGTAGVALYAAASDKHERLARLCLAQLASMPHDHQVNSDLGIAHGVPGVLLAYSCLLRTYNNIADSEQASWMESLACRLLEIANPSCNVSVGYKVGDSRIARLAWCYGDLSVSLALASYGRSTRNPLFTDSARSIAERALSRPMSEWGVVDYGLCHGSSGIELMILMIEQLAGPLAQSERARSALLETHKSRLSFDRNYGKESLIGGFPGPKLIAELGNLSAPKGAMAWAIPFVGLV